MPQNPSFAGADSPAVDKLIAGDHPRLTRPVVILTGQNLVRGAVLGRITASGKYILSLTGAGDGSNVARGILVDDVNATAADKAASIYRSGEFNKAALVFGAAHTAVTVQADFDTIGVGIELKDVVAN